MLTRIQITKNYNLGQKYNNKCLNYDRFLWNSATNIVPVTAKFWSKPAAALDASVLFGVTSEGVSAIRIRWGSQTICRACGVGFVETRISLVFKSNRKDQNNPSNMNQLFDNWFIFYTQYEWS